MLVQVVKFETTLSEEEATRVAREREPEYRATPGLIEKFYVKFGAPNTYCGIMIWESAEALAAFRQTELFRSVPQAYSVVGTPEVSVGEMMFMLRDGAILAAA